MERMVGDEAVREKRVERNECEGVMRNGLMKEQKWKKEE
jgi:hypothetical protein